jgi:hypothetical protein
MRSRKCQDEQAHRIYSAIDKYIKLLSHPDDAVRHQTRRFVLDAWLILLQDVAGTPTHRIAQGGQRDALKC